MTIAELRADRETKYLVDENMLYGHIAMWAVRQSLAENGSGLTRTLYLHHVITHFKRSVVDLYFNIVLPGLKMKRFTFEELETLLKEKLLSIDIVKDWNAPIEQNVLVGDHLKNEFIDLDALIRNIAWSVINEIILL